MATCNDCAHVEACKAIVTIINEATGLQINDDTETTIDADLNCEYFADRSRFVELPCKHGDTLFRIKNGKIEKGVATAFFYGSEFQIVNCRFPKISIGIPFHRFGKTVFLTKEEAERALKERESE